MWLKRKKLMCWKQKMLVFKELISCLLPYYDSWVIITHAQLIPPTVSYEKESMICWIALWAKIKRHKKSVLFTENIVDLAVQGNNRRKKKKKNSSEKHRRFTHICPPLWIFFHSTHFKNENPVNALPINYTACEQDEELPGSQMLTYLFPIFHS